MEGHRIAGVDDSMFEGLSDAERRFVLAQVGEGKSVGVAVMLCFFLGGLGAHAFYLRSWLYGAVLFVFSWTLVPSLWCFIDMFLVPTRVRRFNRQEFEKAASHARLLAGGRAPSTPQAVLNDRAASPHQGTPAPRQVMSAARTAESSRKCPVCAAEVDAGTTFCVSCGQAFDAGASRADGIVVKAASTGGYTHAALKADLGPGMIGRILSQRRPILVALGAMGAVAAVAVVATSIFGGESDGRGTTAATSVGSAGGDGRAGSAAQSGGGVVRYVTASTLNLRASPDKAASVVARLPIATRCAVLDNLGEWMSTSCEGADGQVRGYLKTEYLSEKQPTLEDLMAELAGEPSPSKHFTAYAKALSLAPARTDLIPAARQAFFKSEFALLDEIRANPTRKTPRAVKAYCDHDYDTCLSETLSLGSQVFISNRGDDFDVLDLKGTGEVKAVEYMGHWKFGDEGETLMIENEIAYRDPPSVFATIFGVAAIEPAASARAVTPPPAPAPPLAPDTVEPGRAKAAALFDAQPGKQRLPVVVASAVFIRPWLVLGHTVDGDGCDQQQPIGAAEVAFFKEQHQHTTKVLRARCAENGRVLDWLEVFLDQDRRVIRANVDLREDDKPAIVSRDVLRAIARSPLDSPERKALTRSPDVYWEYRTYAEKNKILDQPIDGSEPALAPRTSAFASGRCTLTWLPALTDGKLDQLSATCTHREKE